MAEQAALQVVQCGHVQCQAVACQRGRQRPAPAAQVGTRLRVGMLGQRAAPPGAEPDCATALSRPVAPTPTWSTVHTAPRPLWTSPTLGIGASTM